MANRTPKSAWAALFNFAGGGRIHIELFAEIFRGMPGSTFLELIAENILLRGTHAARPAVADVPIGTEYYETDTTNRFKSNGTSWLADGQSGSGETQLIKTATVTLTDAQIKALPTTAIEVLAAPGANKATVLIAAIITTALVADYTNVQTPSMLGLTLGSAGVLPFSVDADDQMLYLDPGLTSRLADVMPTYMPINQKVEVASTNTQDFTGGNAANTMTITIFYVTVNT